MLIGRGGVVLSRQPWSSFVSSRKRKWWWDGLIIEFARENVLILVMFTNLFVYFYFFHWRNYLFHFFSNNKNIVNDSWTMWAPKAFCFIWGCCKRGGDNNWISVFHFVGVSVCILKAKPCDDQNLFECVDNMPNDSTMTSFNHATILNNHENKEKKVRYPFFFLSF